MFDTHKQKASCTLILKLITVPFYVTQTKTQQNPNVFDSGALWQTWVLFWTEFLQRHCFRNLIRIPEHDCWDAKLYINLPLLSQKQWSISTFDTNRRRVVHWFWSSWQFLSTWHRLKYSKIRMFLKVVHCDRHECYFELSFCKHSVADHFNIVGLRIAGVSYGQSVACNVSWSVSVYSGPLAIRRWREIWMRSVRCW